MGIYRPDQVSNKLKTFVTVPLFVVVKCIFVCAYYKFNNQL